MSDEKNEYRVEVGQSGQITLPLPLCKVYGINEGNLLAFQDTGRGLTLQTTQDAFEKIQSLVAPYLETLDSPLADFLRWRRREAKNEEQKFSPQKNDS